MDTIKIELDMKVYSLKLDTLRQGDPAYDAIVIPNENSNKYSHYFINPNLYSIDKLPSKINYLANFSYVESYDFLFNDTGLLLVSQKVLSLIKDYSSIKCTAVPVLLIDDTYLEDKFNNCGELLSDVPVNKEFYALRFEELKSYFDFENSDFRPSRFDPEIPGRIRKLVLREPAEGFPEIFRTKEKASEIFVLESFKNKIEEASIKGCLFDEVEVTPFSEGHPA